jgi:alpha-D-xyloside xylohydrolase
MLRNLVWVHLLSSGAAVSQPPELGIGGCLLVRDGSSAQDVRMEAHGVHAIRVRAVPLGGSFRDDLVSALVSPPSSHAFVSPGLCTEVTLTTEPLSLTNGNLKSSMGPDGRITFTRVSDGTVLLQETTVRTLTPAATKPPIPGFLELDLTFDAVPDERIYGLGQHAKLPWDPSSSSERLNMKGVKGLLLAPHDGEILIPVVHSSRGYAFLFNLPSLGMVEYNDTTSYWHADAVLQADFWVSTTADGPAHSTSPWLQLQSAYADATGHTPVWPAWTTGFWQCKLRYSNQSQIMDVVQGYVDREIPISLIIIDFFSWNDPTAPKDRQNTLGDETLPASCWPDPKQMVQRLKELGVELMVSPYSHSVRCMS